MPKSVANTICELETTNVENSAGLDVNDADSYHASAAAFDLQDVSHPHLDRGVVVLIRPTGEVVVALENHGHVQLDCELAEGAEGWPIRLVPGDRVLVWIPAFGEGLGAVVGRLGIATQRHSASDKETVYKTDGRLTIQCGKASITLQEDGKVLIRGVDVVTRASATQRIKGGSVRIN